MKNFIQGKTRSELYEMFVKYSSNILISSGLHPNIKPFISYGRMHRIQSSGYVGALWSRLGEYTGFPVSNFETLELVSTSSDDTFGGVGAHKVLISGLLDENFEICDDVIVDLNGATPVSLGNKIYSRGATLIVLSAGTSEANVGDVELRYSQTLTSVFNIILAGENKSLSSVFTVPKNKILMLDKGSIGISRINGSDGSCDFSLKVRLYGGVFITELSGTVTNQQVYQYDERFYKMIPEKSDLLLHIEDTSDNNTSIFSELSGMLINE